MSNCEEKIEHAIAFAGKYEGFKAFLAGFGIKIGRVSAEGAALEGRAVESAAEHAVAHPDF